MKSIVYTGHRELSYFVEMISIIYTFLNTGVVHFTIADSYNANSNNIIYYIKNIPRP